MGLFHDISEGSGPAMKHLPGHHSQRRQTDQQCPHCGRWFAIQGYDGHLPNCPVRLDPYLTYSERRDSITAMTCNFCGCTIRRDRVHVSGNPLVGDEHDAGCDYHPDQFEASEEVREMLREAVGNINIEEL